MKSILLFLILVIFTACSPAKTIFPTIEPTQQNILAPSLLGEWTMGQVEDMAWSPNSKMFAVNYFLPGNDLNNVQAFDVKSLKSMWTANDSRASDLTFTLDGQFIVESNTNVPLFYWRNMQQGKVVHMGELTDINQMKDIDCHGGGQIIITSANKNIALMVDYLDLIGLNTNYTVLIRQLDLATGKCKELFNYEGSFDIFDLNSSGTLLAYGGVGKDDSVIIWNTEKQVEVCRTPKVDFGRFVPNENTLAVIKNQKIVFIDAATCREIRELNTAPAHDHETYFAFSSDGQSFAIAKDSIQIMNTSTGKTLAKIRFPQNAGPNSVKLFLNEIKFSPDGHDLLVTYGNEVQLWQLQK